MKFSKYKYRIIAVSLGVVVIAAAGFVFLNQKNPAPGEQDGAAKIRRTRTVSGNPQYQKLIDEGDEANFRGEADAALAASSSRTPARA